MQQEPTSTPIQKTFEECAIARAHLQTAMISKIGNTDSAFFAFHRSLAELYNRALPNDELRSIPFGDGMLITLVSEWLQSSKNWKDGVHGGILFEKLTVALASVGML